MTKPAPESERSRRTAPAKVRFGLRTKLLLWTLAAVNVAFISVWLISTITARQGMLALANENLGLGAQNLADGVANVVNDTYADALTSSRLDLAVQAIETGDPKNFSWYADELVQQKGRYAALFVADRNGKIVGANTLSRHGKKLGGALTGRSISESEWMGAGLAASKGQGVWVPPSHPAFLEGDAQEADGVVGFSFPVFDILDERIGTLTVLLSIASVSQQLDGYVTGGDTPDSVALVIDALGNPVALPESLPFRAEWKRLQVIRGEGQLVLNDPRGAQHIVVERPIRGAAERAGWRAAATRTTTALDAPVDRIGDRLLWAFLAAVGLTTLVLVLMANRLIGPIRELTLATRGVGRASEYQPLAVRTTDEVGTLASSFNELFRSLREHEEDLEQKVAARTRDLELARSDLAEILDNMRHGIFTVGPDGRIGNEFSAYTRQLFAGQPIAGQEATALLQLSTQGDRQAESRMRFWLENIFGADELQWILSSQDGVKEIRYQPAQGGEPHYLELEYAPVFGQGRVSKVMVIAKDVTELKALELAMRTKERSFQQNLDRIAEIAGMDAELFATFLDESRALCERSAQAFAKLVDFPTDRPALDETFRAVHTLKGNARAFRVTRLHDLAHDAEDELQQLRDRGGAPNPEAVTALVGRMADLSAEVDVIERLGRQVLFGDKARPRMGTTLQISESRLIELRRRYRELARALPASAARAELGKLDGAIGELTSLPLQELFDRLRKDALDLARTLGKQLNDLEVKGGDIAVDQKLCAKLSEVLMHALRNAVDHGIETSAVRRASKKPDRGTIRLEAAREGAELVITLSDDGAGFDVERLKRRALSMGLLTQREAAALDDKAALELCFLPGVSSSERVTEVSGRGVGMDVVKSGVTALRGSIGLSSSPGRGSRLSFRLPLEHERSSRVEES